VARCVQDSVRTTDLVCRYGGEEFCVIVPGLHGEGLLALAERIRSRIQTECGPGVREVPDLKITTSVGAEPQGRLATSVQEMIDHADQALYSAKRGGRNRVVAFEAETAAA
jgi:diguanylate cyclase